MGMPDSCVIMYPGKEAEIQVLAGLALFSQTVGSLMRASWLAKPSIKIQHKVCSVNSFQWEKTLNYF